MGFPVVYTPEPARPSGGPQPGTRNLLGWIVSPEGWDAADAFDDVDPTNLGIYNPRDVCGNQWPFWECKGSQHARGAAGDAGFPVVLPGGHAEGHKLANWLVANHRALGIQEVIWAERRWHNKLGVIPHSQWPKYIGRSKHYDHVHFAQNDAGAKGLTVAMIKAVAPAPAPPDPTPPAEPVYEEDNDMQLPALIVAADSKPGEWFVTDGITKQHLKNKTHATLLLNQKKATAEAGTGDMTNPDATKPFIWPKAAVDSIRLVGPAPV